MVSPMRVAIRGLVIATTLALITAGYLLLVAPRLLDPDNMAAPLLFVALPLFLVHALLSPLSAVALSVRLAHCTQILCPVRYPVMQFS
jgi:hypothetical protein